MSKKTKNLSLSQISLYKVVFFSDNFVIFEHPYYSLPHYDKIGIGIKKLIDNIIRRKRKDYKYAVIYNVKTREKLHYYIDGVEVPKFNFPKTELKIWIKYIGQNEKLTFRTPYINEQLAYWELVNRYIKAKGQRAKIELAIVYNENDERIGIFNRVRRKNRTEVIGIGKFHKRKINGNNR